MINDPNQILKDVIKFNNPNVLTDLKGKIDKIISDITRNAKLNPIKQLQNISSTLGVVINNTVVSNQKLTNLMKNINDEINNVKSIGNAILNINNNINVINSKLDRIPTSNGEFLNTILGSEEYENGRYFGELKNGKKDGKGVYYYSNGDRYEGDWKAGLRDGKGVYYYSNGERYEGDFKEDKFTGRGVFHYKDGTREMGDYKENVPTGVFARLHPDGKVEAIKC